MRRAAVESLKKWFDGRKRHPLVIRGARQVGKSTLVRDFAAREGLTLNEINLYRNLNVPLGEAGAFELENRPFYAVGCKWPGENG